MSDQAPQAFGHAICRRRCAWSVYGCVAEDGTALYVGFTGRGSGRLAEHTGKPWWQAVGTIRLWHFETEEQARRFEADLIEDWSPLFNTRGRPVGAPALLIRHEFLEGEAT